MTTPFQGFLSSSRDEILIPAEFFNDLFPKIEDLGELRVCLYSFWALSRVAQEPKFFRLSEARGDKLFANLFGNTEEEREHGLAKAFERTCQRGMLIEARLEGDTYYFLNTPRGRAACEGLLGGKWQPGNLDEVVTALQPERPNIFALYEQNIGPLTPILAETLQEAEREYPTEWVADAIKVAIMRNARNWRFVDAVLKTWKEKGRHGTDQRSAKEGRKRDSEGEFADYVKR